LVAIASFAAKFFVSISFYIVYVMTPELFPTRLRHTTSALASGFARIGGIIVSFIIYSDKYVSAPIIGVVIILVTVPVITLPKTHNVPLPKNIEEALAMKKGTLKRRKNKNKGEKINDEESSECLQQKKFPEEV